MTDSIDFRIDELPSESEFEGKGREICAEVKDDAGLIGKLGWSVIGDAALKALRQGLAEQSPLSLLAHAWTKSNEVRKAAGETMRDGGSDRHVPLASHKLSQTVHPVVTLKCGPSNIEMEFTVDLTAKVDCADLLLRNGRLVELEAVRMTPSAALSFRKIGLGHKTYDPIDLTAPYRFPNGGWLISDEDKQITDSGS